jgi:hypothetical protein
LPSFPTNRFTWLATATATALSMATVTAMVATLIKQFL